MNGDYNQRDAYAIRRLSPEEARRLFPSMRSIAALSKFSAGLRLKDMHVAFAAFRGHRLVGFAGLTCYNGFWGLRGCAVHPDHRGHGLQSRLIGARISFLKEERPRAKHVNVWVSPENPHSMTNLLLAGFRPVDQLSRSFHGVECIKLRKLLR